MREYVTEAIVLDREEAGEADVNLTLYTEKLGRVSARATSMRKIISKLAAHLAPLMRTEVRIVETRAARRGGTRFQVADALASGQAHLVPVAARLLKELAPEGEPDLALWNLCVRGRSSPAAVLRLLGFDPRFARCDRCGSEAPSYFTSADFRYWCASCAAREGTGREAAVAFIKVSGAV